MSTQLVGGEALIEKIIYGVSIFFANSLYDLVKALDAQILVSVVAMFVAFSVETLCILAWVNPKLSVISCLVGVLITFCSNCVCSCA